jgi:hypothetical protein
MTKHDIHTPGEATFANYYCYRNRVGCNRCRESVRDPGTWPRYSQCSRTGSVEEIVDGVSMWFCKTHSLAQQNARAEASAAKYKAERDTANAKWQNQRDAPKFRAALEAIANGYNDPRALARAALGIDQQQDETY